MDSTPNTGSAQNSFRLPSRVSPNAQLNAQKPHLHDDNKALRSVSTVVTLMNDANYQNSAGMPDQGKITTQLTSTTKGVGALGLSPEDAKTAYDAALTGWMAANADRNPVEFDKATLPSSAPSVTNLADPDGVRL